MGTGAGSGSGGGVGAEGVTAADAVEARESPATLLALTVNRYPVPLLSPVHAAEFPDTVQTAPAGDDVTV